MTITRNFATAFGVGVAVIAIAVAGIFYMQRGAHIALPGKILKVRTVPLDENSSLAAIDFRVTNPSDYPFQVHSVTVILEDQSGHQSEGQTVSDMDVKRVFAGMPLLGEKYNDVLKERDRISPHSTSDCMVMARLEFPEAKLASRKRFLIHIEEADGAVSEFGETSSARPRP